MSEINVIDTGAPVSYSNGVSADEYCGGGLWSFFETVGAWLTRDNNFAAMLVPCVLMFIYGTYYIVRVRRCKLVNPPYNWMWLLKLVLAVGILMASLVMLGNSLYANFAMSHVKYQFLAMPVCVSIASLEAIIAMISEQAIGMRHSYVLGIYWIAASLLGSIEMIAVFDRIQQTHNHFEQTDASTFDTIYNISYVAYYALTLALTLMAQFVEPRGDYLRLGEQAEDANDCPEHAAPLLSKLTFWWMTPTMRDGWDHSLEHDELFGLDIDNQAGHISETFEANWEIELTKWRKSGVQPSLVRALVKSFGMPYLFGGFLKFIQDCCAFVSPQILKQLICFTKHEDIDVYYGYLFTGLLFTFALIQSIMVQQYFHRSFATGMRVRAAIVAALYKKSLVISNSARSGTTLGEITNLMSVDAQRFMDLLPYLHMIWSGPLQICLAMYFLWDTMGPSVLAGVAVLILAIPINAVVARIVRRFQVEQMNVKDQRMKLVNEVLAGMKVIKLYAWEKPFLATLGRARTEELNVLRRIQYFGAGTSFIWNTTPFLVSLVTFLSYVALGHQLTAEKAFVALSLFNLLQFPVAMFPNVINSCIEASVSLGRVHKFLVSEEINTNGIVHTLTKSPINEGAWGTIKVTDGAFAWSEEETPTLQNINLHIEQGELICVAGRVGCGKSSLVSAILGEMNKIKGTIVMHGKVAYVPQQAWIQNATVRDNILFGQSFDRTKYDNIVSACALRDDFDMLDDGDQTEIGEKGINLSGGQKQRISLARALYQEADIYIFDDPLSAVDAHVGRHIFDKALGPNSLLKDTTRFLVTHKIEILPESSRIIVLKHGQIDEIGHYNALLNAGGEFGLFLEEFRNKQNEQVDDVYSDGELDVEEVTEATGLVRRRSSKVRAASVVSMKRSESVVKEKKKLIESEVAATGNVSANVFMMYFESMGYLTCIAILVTYIFSQIFQLSSSVWLSHWSSVSSADPVFANEHWGYYLGIYGACGIGFSLFTVFVVFISAIGSITASQALHDDMLNNTLRCPMSFFDTTPLGRIVNRFSKDMYTVDESLPNSIRAFMGTLFRVLGTIVVIAYATPIFLSVVLPMAVVYVLVQRFYVATSRQLKRLDSVSRSPIFAHFGETLNGVSTIRAYKAGDRFINMFEQHLNHNQKAYYPSVSANRWLAVRLELNGNFIVFFAALFAVLARGDIDPSIVGLSVSYALSVTQGLNWIVRMSSELESNVVAVERVKEYTDVPTEAPAVVSGHRPPKLWPSLGEVKFTDVSIRYRDGLPNVLKNVSVDIKGTEKVGVVGRTGAGKSSLTLALFRIMELSSGDIVIDGLNVADMGLEDLRSRLTIIPQDPILFTGTLRSNLDPFDTYDEAALWKTVENCHMRDYVESQALKLDSPVYEDGSNLSVGQRQLVCLGRALLRKTKILLLDEATAACDLETDELIQATIRKEFKDCTIITIAHRLKTIMDSDKILVLDQGKVAEYDSPDNLLSDTNTIFYGLAKESGIVN